MQQRGVHAWSRRSAGFERRATRLKMRLIVSLEGSVFGFAAETGLHALRLIVAGVFDRFSHLQMVLGHLGEALPYWLYRLDLRMGSLCGPIAMPRPSRSRSR